MAATYTVRMLKRALRLNLPPMGTAAEMIAEANGMTGRELHRMPLVAYRKLNAEFARETAPHPFSRHSAPEGDRVEIRRCQCVCECAACGLERKCFPCNCKEELIGTIAAELTAGHVINANGDPVALTEAIAGQRCDDMALSDFRTLQEAIADDLGVDELPLLES